MQVTQQHLQNWNHINTDNNYWLQKICTTCFQRFAPLALPQACKRYAPLARIDIHLRLQKIRTPVSKRYAPLSQKDKHL